MLRPNRFVALFGGLIALIGVQATASAQGYPGYNPCMQCVQPVAQTCYQTVPVTEYQPVKRMVQRPVVETKYVDQKVTAYRPITETKTASVPTVHYENVTECQTVQRDLSHWQTNYYRNPKMTPCQYDPRPNLLGWLNRTGYSIRQTFTPNVIARRQYVRNVVATAVPVTRQVAVRGTRQVSYKVTRMEPYTTTRKVAVNSVRYVSEEVTTMRPVTVMRSVPIGTATAFLPYGAGAPTATALQPTPDPVGAAPSRTAESNDRAEPYRRGDLDDQGARNEAPVPTRDASFTIPSRTTARPVVEPQVRNDDRFEGYRPVRESTRRTKYPSIIRISRGWAPHKQTSTGPRLSRTGISLAAANR